MKKLQDMLSKGTVHQSELNALSWDEILWLANNGARFNVICDREQLNADYIAWHKKRTAAVGAGNTLPADPGQYDTWHLYCVIRINGGEVTPT